MLQWKMRRVSDKIQSSTDTTGDGSGGHCDLLVIPRGASHEDCLLRVTAYIEKMGDRPEDLWIRRVKLAGKWLPKQYGFKTGSGQYGEDSNYLVRMGTDEWKQPVELLKASDGLMSVAIHNKTVPTHNFEQALAQDVSLVIGPVTVGVTYATSNKDDINFNHLDVHLKGLTDVRQLLGGILAEEPPRSDDEDEPSEDKPVEDEPELSEGQPSEGQLNEEQPDEGQPNEEQLTEEQLNEEQPNEGQPNEAQPDEAQPSEAQPSEAQLNEGQPNEGQPNQGQHDHEVDDLQLVQSSTQTSRNTIYKTLPSASSMKFDWCCEGGKCTACRWE